MTTNMAPVTFDRLHRGHIEFHIEKFARTKDYTDDADNLSGRRMVTEDGDHVCDNNDYYPAECNPEYVRRILACLQYCHLMPTEDLEKSNALMGTRK